MVEDEEPMVDEGDEAAESSNRMFMLLAGGMFAVLVLGLICIGGYAFLQGQQRNNQNAQATAAVIKTVTAIAASTIKAMPTNTPAPTDTPMPEPPTSTPNPPTPTVQPVTDTPAPPATATTAGKPLTTPLSQGTAVASTNATATAGTSSGSGTGSTTGTGPTGAGGGNVTPTPSEGMPGSGWGEMGALFLAVALVAMLFIARSLRGAQSRR